MRYSSIILFSLLMCLFNSSQSILALPGQVPANQRSTQVYANITPVLKQQLYQKKLHFGAPIFIRIFKQPPELELWIKNQNQFILFKVYKICYYSGRLGPKTAVGDLQSPEGFYFVTSKSMNPWSKFHLSFNLGYPNRYDRDYSRTGNALMVHGNCVSIGCYAMTDAGINEIYTLAAEALNKGQLFFRVHIFPFRLTEKKLSKYKNNKWFKYWLNLKTGYDLFEENLIPPNVNVKNKNYTFN